MKILLKTMPYIFMALILFSLLISGFFFYLSYQSLPKYRKDVFSSDIQSKISIKTDLYAVPHITGQSDEETFFGLGYIHAQERLWQMTYLKRISQGRLSEISGPETVLLDKFMKSLDLQTLSKEIFQNLSLELKKILSSIALENIKDVSSISVKALLDDINSINFNIVKLSTGLHGVTSGDWKKNSGDPRPKP